MAPERQVDPPPQDPSTEILDTTPRPSALPDRIGRYHTKRVIASGGMGTVYEAAQDNPRRVVAVKVMKQGIASKSALRRFEYEGRSLVACEPRHRPNLPGRNNTGKSNLLEVIRHALGPVTSQTTGAQFATRREECKEFRERSRESIVPRLLSNQRVCRTCSCNRRASYDTLSAFLAQ